MILFSEFEEESGIISLDSILHETDSHKTHHLKWLSSHSRGNAQENLALQREQLINMYKLCEVVHVKDTRKEINPRTNLKYPFLEHTTKAGLILSLLGYLPKEISAGLGHDLKDKHKEFNIKGLMDEYDFYNSIKHDRIALELIQALADKPYDLLGGTSFGKHEDKENTLMEKLQVALFHPQILSIMAADRYHNLESFQSYNPGQQIRIFTETKDLYMPLIKSVDIKLYSMLQHRILELEKDMRFDDLPMDFGDYKKFLDYLFKRNSSFSNPDKQLKLNHLMDNYDTDQFKLLRNLKEVEMNLFNGRTPTCFPNHPKFSDISNEERENYLDFVKENENLVLDVKNIKILSDFFKSYSSFSTVSRVLSELHTKRIYKRIIHDYFLEIDLNEKIDERKFVQHTQSGFIKSSYKSFSEEKVDHIISVQPKNISSKLGEISSNLGLGTPMVMFEKKFNGEIINKLNNLGIDKGEYNPKGKNNVYGLRVIYCNEHSLAQLKNTKQFTVVDLVGAYF